MNLSIDKHGDVPAYEQIRQQITELVQTGLLAAGAKLPSVRELARSLGVSVKTVRRAYDELGADSILQTRHDRIDSPGVRVTVKDTVGAGDAFSAGLLVKFLEGAPLREMARYANLCGAYVASQHGATPPFSRDLVAAFEKQST